mmetsp:Transcript_13935/g.44632  ORF Transcript_13935/g.44632 Transcript_13935/m.44632 type:complete len:271 (-) Transcript_13935:580-1392(-)
MAQNWLHCFRAKSPVQPGIRRRIESSLFAVSCSLSILSLHVRIVRSRSFWRARSERLSISSLVFTLFSSAKSFLASCSLALMLCSEPLSLLKFSRATLALSIFCFACLSRNSDSSFVAFHARRSSAASSRALLLACTLLSEDEMLRVATALLRLSASTSSWFVAPAPLVLSRSLCSFSCFVRNCTSASADFTLDLRCLVRSRASLTLPCASSNCSTRSLTLCRCSCLSFSSRSLIAFTVVSSRSRSRIFSSSRRRSASAFVLAWSSLARS